LQVLFFTDQELPLLQLAPPKCLSTSRGEAGADGNYCAEFR
jgi:hypothetical protein